MVNSKAFDINKMLLKNKIYIEYNMIPHVAPIKFWSRETAAYKLGTKNQCCETGESLAAPVCP